MTNKFYALLKNFYKLIIAPFYSDVHASISFTKSFVLISFASGLKFASSDVNNFTNRPYKKTDFYPVSGHSSCHVLVQSQQRKISYV